MKIGEITIAAARSTQYLNYVYCVVRVDGLTLQQQSKIEGNHACSVSGCSSAARVHGNHSKCVSLALTGNKLKKIEPVASDDPQPASTSRSDQLRFDWRVNAVQHPLLMVALLLLTLLLLVLLLLVLLILLLPLALLYLLPLLQPSLYVLIFCRLG